MSSNRFLGAVLLLAGVAFLFGGLNASQSVADRLNNFFTGHFSDFTVWSLIGGGVAMAVGLLMVVFGGPRRELS